MPSMPAAVPTDPTPIVAQENGHLLHSNNFYSDLVEMAKLVVGPAWLNAVGEGATRDGTTNDAPALNAALTTLETAGGGILFLPPGTYSIAAPLIVPARCHLIGAGIDDTILQIQSGSFANFASSYMILRKTSVSVGHSSVMSGFTLDGNLRSGSGSANQGGLIAVGNHWHLSHFRLYDANYFKLWINGASHGSAVKLRWESTGGGEDNIGGGAADDWVFDDCFWASDIGGNVFDHVKSTRLTFVNCTNESDNVMYFEGCTECTVDKYRSAGPVQFQSAMAYASQTETRNPKNCKVTDSEFNLTSSLTHGIMWRYDNHVSKTLVPGGGNHTRGNTVRNVGKVGILKHGFRNATDQTGNPQIIGDHFTDNTVINSNLDGTNTWNTGNGVVANAGIALLNMWRDVITGNHAGDDQGTPTTPHTVSIGATGFVTQNIECLESVVADNTGYGLTGEVVNERGSSTFVKRSNRIHDNISDDTLDIASAATITLPHHSDFFNITGTTNITSVTASMIGRRVTLKFAGILTFTDGSNLILNGNFVTSADDTITLVCNGTNWYEVARSAN